MYFPESKSLDTTAFKCELHDERADDRMAVMEHAYYACKLFTGCANVSFRLPSDQLLRCLFPLR
jgi:hypothetical protein